MSDKKTSESVICLEHLKKLIDKDTRENIAKAFGCDTSLITKHYTGKRDVTAEYIVKYAKYFNVSADYLLGLTTVKSTDIGIKNICEYTGLDEKSVQKLHLISKPLREKAEDYYPFNDFITEDMFYGRIEYTKERLSVIDFFLCSEYFSKVINEILEYTQNMKERTEAIKNAFKESENLDVIKIIACFSDLPAHINLRLSYFEAKEHLNKIIDDYCEPNYSEWVKTEEKMKYFSDYRQEIQERLLKNIDKSLLPSDFKFYTGEDYNLTEEEKKEIDQIKRMLSGAFYTDLDFEDDNHGNDNKTE